MNRHKLTVSVITHNEEANIGECLQGVKWADEIIVVDSESSDNTVAIAREHTDKVFVNPWPGYRDQKNYALERASNPWVLSLDADERIPPETRDFILKELAAPAFDAYRFPRRNFFLGKWLRHGGWYPDHVLRLFRKDKGRFGGLNLHEKVLLDSGKVGTAPVPIIHYTYKSLAQYVSKQNLYSSLAAAEKARSGGSAGRAAPFGALLRAIWKFIEVYVLKRGFLDGPHGLVAAVGAAYASFSKYTKIWEMKKR